MSSPSPTPAITTRPWLALGALCIGFFMILVDMTIVSVAQPAIQRALDTDVNGVIWVSSAYLLTYAVPMLVAGRLGDRYGPKNVYLIGLVVFTVASVWCGFAGSIEMLILARGLQGVGAALITPQTMALITRIFPENRRGAAMGVWGTVAGVATLIGPLAGGGLVDGLGWEWIFFVNVPVGIIGLALAWKLVPQVSTSKRHFDLVGMALSGIGLTCLVFGIQDGEKYDWAAWIWGLIGVGLVLMALFVYWQHKILTVRRSAEPLVPLRLFRDRNFSLASIGITTMGFATAGMMVPLMYYLQLVAGLTPTESAVVTVPMAVLTGVLAPIVGRQVDRVHPRYIVATALLLNAVAIGWLAMIATPTTPIWQLLLPVALMGAASSGIWAPLAATATRNLPMTSAGAGAGVYNTTRLIGSVLGSAAVGALMQTRLAAEVPGFGSSSMDQAGRLPESVRDGFSAAMGQSLLLPAAALLIGVVAAAAFARPRHMMEAVVPAGGSQLGDVPAGTEGAAGVPKANSTATAAAPSGAGD
ncbi:MULTISPECIES: DHA2 family efflux MFS transporter permease subunit [Actinomycetes]|uniref:DHA2 family efflux MFS transporter permease subunit n=1 Tax=Actinomycetes TaxID=1760 RepID=UPI0009DE8E44|nr:MULTISPECIES: DHA2 family efflux MFS transporter permease subunit [Actinomycetes]